jgi:DNA-directed RNA polymerase sigma subunit (sigma70/sigma32)
MKNQKGICKPCRVILEETSKVPKRIEVLETKYQTLAPMLDKFESGDKAFTYLEHFFKPRQKKLLEVLIERYYYRDRTLDQIGKKRGVSREYIRQCENKAIEILTQTMSLDEDDEKKFEEFV